MWKLSPYRGRIETEAGNDGDGAATWSIHDVRDSARESHSLTGERPVVCVGGGRAGRDSRPVRCGSRTATDTPGGRVLPRGFQERRVVHGRAAPLPGTRWGIPGDHPAQRFAHG